MTKRQRTRNKMFAHIERWQSSGLTQRAYCRKARINHNGFYYWVKQFKGQINLDPAPACFIPVSVQVPEENVSDRIIVTGPNGMEILFPCTQHSIALIRQLLMG
jgi:hypothetical protein